MEIDITSIIIGIAALSTFFVPIGLHQFSHKRKNKKTQHTLETAAIKNRLRIDQLEVLRGGGAICIDNQQKIVLYIKNETETVISLEDIAGCKPYNDQRKETLKDGSKAVIHEQGIQLSFQASSKKSDVKLLFFHGKEGSTFGDEGVIIDRWIGKIKSVLKISPGQS